MNDDIFTIGCAIEAIKLTIDQTEDFLNNLESNSQEEKAALAELATMLSDSAYILECMEMQLDTSKSFDL